MRHYALPPELLVLRVLGSTAVKFCRLLPTHTLTQFLTLYGKEWRDRRPVACDFELLVSVPSLT